MGKFRRLILHVDKQDNSAPATRAKIEVRNRVLDAIGASEARVFDGFAGSGAMHTGVWHRASRYTGCDLKFYRDDRECFVADNRRVLRSIDLTEFNLFDFDAYGSPWDQMFILAARRPLREGEKVGVIVTDGTAMKLKMGGLPNTLAQLAGLKPWQSGIAQAATQDQIILKAMRRVATSMHGAVGKYWQANGAIGSRMVYCGAVLERNPT